MLKRLLLPFLPPCSISSSSAVDEGEVSICVARLSYTLHTGEQREGFCSSFLTSLPPGARLRFRTISQPSFRLPLNLAAPVVMIATGTGVSPFKVGCAVSCGSGGWKEGKIGKKGEGRAG